MLSSPLNAPLDHAKASPLGAPLGSTTSQGLDTTLAEALAGIDVMTPRSVSEATTDAQVPLLLSSGVDALGIAVDGNQLHPIAGTTASQLASWSSLTISEIDDACPATGFSGYTLPNQAGVDVYLPKLSLVRKESLIDVTPNGVGIDSDGDGIPESGWHVYVGSMLVCDDVVTDVVFLGKPWSGTWKQTAVVDKLRPYEPDIDYLCLRTTDATSTELSQRWRCIRGRVFEGVVGDAYRTVPDHPERSSPGSRTFYVRSLHYGSTDWNASFSPMSELGAVVEHNPDPTDAASPWWGFGPKERTDGRTMLAAIAVKTTTNHRGIAIAPYTGSGSGAGSRAPDVTFAPGALLALGPLFDPCSGATASVAGPERDCGWVPDQVVGCTPGTSVVVGMGANVTDCGAPLGTGNDDNVIRICDGMGACTHASPDKLAESDDACGTHNPSVEFTCGASGVFSVMKGTHDATTSTALDAPGGGVPGLVVATPVVSPPRTVLDACSLTEAATLECGWTVQSSATCTPGRVIVITAAPPSGVPIRICDGLRACTATSTRRLAQGIDSATATCGASGVVTVLVGPSASGSPDAAFTASGDGAAMPAPSFERSPDVASSGDLQNDLLLHVAMPGDGSPRSCDWSSSWGVGEVAVGTGSIDVSAFSFRVGANYDASSGFTRCPSDDPPPAAICGSGAQRTVFVNVLGGDQGYSVCNDDTSTAFTSLGTVQIAGKTCCTAFCSYTFAGCAAETKLAVYDTSGAAATAVGWSEQASSAPRTSIIVNHDWLITVDALAPRTPETPSCNFDGVCDPSETATGCPADCKNPSFPQIDLAFDAIPNAILPNADHAAPIVTVPADFKVLATGPSGAVVAYSVSAIDAHDGAVPVTCAPASGSTFAIGTTPVTCTASDAAGNVGTASFRISVENYQFCGFAQPINSDGTSIFKYGSTVPVKFLLCDGMTSGTATLSIVKVDNGVEGTVYEAVSNGAADTGNRFHYDATTGAYTFNLGTRQAGLNTGTFKLTATLGDGTTHSILISIRR